MTASAPSDYRSVLEDQPDLPSQPRASLIVPTFNEMGGIDALVSDLLAQDYPAIAEIWFVDGRSTDGTYERLLALAERDGRIRVAVNPQRITASGVNIGLARATGDVVMRVDAHARYRPEVVRLCVDALVRTGAAGAGVVARPAPATTAMGRAIVAAHRSPFGIGVARFRREGEDGWTSTIWNGCYWRFVLDRVGPMREDLVRAEDNDFNARVRALGYGLYVIGAARAVYQPRRTLGGLADQYRGNGRGIARALLQNPDAVGLHHLAPLGLVGGLLLLGLLAALWPPAALGLATMLALYAGMVLAAVPIAWRQEPGSHVLLLPLVLAVLHVSYGIGTLAELARQASLPGSPPRKMPPLTATGEPSGPPPRER